MRRLVTLAAIVTFGHLVLAGAASATVQLSSTSYTASDRQSSISIEVTRTPPLTGGEYVFYGTRRGYSEPGVDYQNVHGVLRLAPGQASGSFTIPVIPQHFNGPPATVGIFVNGSWPQGLGQVTDARLTILRNAPLDPHNAANPLALGQPPPSGNPLGGVRLYADRWDSPAALAASSYRRSNPARARALGVIANQPWAARFGAWNGADPSRAVAMSLEHAYQHDPGAVPMLATYRIVPQQCERGGRPDSPGEQASYKRWMDGFSRGIGGFRAVLFLELDSLITTPCLTPKALDVRLSELHYAITTLQSNPHLVVYVDAGAADALPWREAAKLLKREGVQQAQGFFLNSTHYDWTTTEISYGQKISRALGGVHFVVNTGDNGRGPLRPKDVAHQGNEVLCNPPGRGLGPRATTSTGYSGVDAFAWTTNPGESGGACVRGAPPTGVYWPAYAVGLVARANYDVTGPGERFLTRAASDRSQQSQAPVRPTPHGVAR
jgi:endoglucanase